MTRLTLPRGTTRPALRAPESTQRSRATISIAIVTPHLTNSTGPAVACYPNLSLPVEIRSSGRPAGVLMYNTFLHEPQLLAFGYDLEQALNARQQPQFLGAIVPVAQRRIVQHAASAAGKAHLPHGRIF